MAGQPADPGAPAGGGQPPAAADPAVPAVPRQADPGAPPPGQLAHTGLGLPALLVLAICLIAIGVLLVRARRSLHPEGAAS